MPPSQLKRLKSSLRDQGITGQQKSRKQKKAAQGGKEDFDRTQRHAALQQIRESFNPFEVKAPSRPAKFQHANSSTNGVSKSGRYKDVLHRPGVTKSAGEEMRRAKLLPEMQRRSKVGGLVDRRIGEGDPGMTAEERAVQRFAQQKQREKGASLFDLEASDDDEPKMRLTHGGRRLDELPVDDLDEVTPDDHGSEADVDLMRKRRRLSDSPEEEIHGVNEAGAEEQPDRKRSKKEVMQEVIAKSKMYKYDRQKAKEDDEDLREKLDKGIEDVMALLKGHKRLPAPPKAAEPTANGVGPTMNPDRQKLLEGFDRAQVDKEYDIKLKQLAQDTKAKPSDRTKTEEEKAREEAERLKSLDEKRLKRMRGEPASDNEEGETGEDEVHDSFDGHANIPDEAAEFGFSYPNAEPTPRNEDLVLDGEDKFELDERLIASGSDVELSDASLSDPDSEAGEDALDFGTEEDEFVQDFLGDAAKGSANDNARPTVSGEAGLSYNYPCPRTHKEFLRIIKDSPFDQLPTIIQRIRALHHPSLSAANKDSMADFSSALVEHLSYMGIEKQPLQVTEQVMRHLHSLSRTYPETIAIAFRRHLQAAYDRRDLHAGDLVILTAIGSIYPTSDHFHQVVTPAMSIISRWLGMNVPDSVQKHDIGVYLVVLCVRYQKLSRRYVPEAARFTLRPLHSKSGINAEQKEAHIENLMAMAELWKDKTAFTEMFRPVIPLLKRMGAKRKVQTLNILLRQARMRRRPLELHHHRPLPIRTSIPKFEEAFNPDKHYDPDKERSDAKKLQKEYKRERKGALRELRKDANFIARQQLGEKKARDAEYEKKYRRLVAEIQGQEGHEAKVYEGEKRARKGKK